MRIGGRPYRSIWLDEATGLPHVIDQTVPAGYWVYLHQDINFESLHDYPPFQEFLKPRG